MKTTAMGVVVVAREQAELQSVALDALGDDEVRGRTLATAVSAGTELNGAYLGDQYPARPGYAAVFEVDEVGPAVQAIAAGDWRFCMGPHRSVQQVAADQTVPVPSGLPAEQAVLARLAGVSMTTLMTTTARPGDRVVVSGLGPVGLLAAELFAASAYEVVGIEPDAARRQWAQTAGLADVREALDPQDPALAGQVALVVECSGHEQAVLDACRVVRPRGEVVLVGVPWTRRSDRTAHAVLHEVFHRYVVLRSGWEWELPQQTSKFQPHGIFSGFTRAMQWLATGRLRVEGLIDLRDPRDAQPVYQDLLHHRTPQPFTVFDWRRLDPRP